MLCACGKTALYRVNDKGFCKEHHALARVQVVKTPQLRSSALRLSNAKGNPAPLKPIMVPPSKKQKKEAFRQHLAKNPTPAEVALKVLLDSHPETRRRYEFQKLIAGYIPDFYSHRANIIIEADGWHHGTTAGRRADARRTANLLREGIVVLRFQNKAILEFPDSTLQAILDCQRARLNRMPSVAR